MKLSSTTGDSVLGAPSLKTTEGEACARCTPPLTLIYFNFSLNCCPTLAAQFHQIAGNACSTGLWARDPEQPDRGSPVT